tara:strand:+ start:7805 stop:8434 length:630 start_codon:yes stop_codon:yes gene_type:complete
MMSIRNSENKHFRKIVIRENKWWYRCIRGMNWFSFRYWWFNWLVFLGCIFLFWCFCPCNIQEVDKNCSSSIDQQLFEIDSLIENCCDCDTVLEPIKIIDPPVSAESPIPCNNKVVPGKLVPGQTQIDEIILGQNPGKITISFDMQSCKDKIEVFYNNRMVAQTGFVRHKGQISFDYRPVPNKYTCIVKMTGGNDGCERTHWTYVIGCPQ